MRAVTEVRCSPARVMGTNASVHPALIRWAQSELRCTIFWVVQRKSWTSIFLNLTCRGEEGADHEAELGCHAGQISPMKDPSPDSMRSTISACTDNLEIS